MVPSVAHVASDHDAPVVQSAAPAARHAVRATPLRATPLRLGGRVEHLPKQAHGRVLREAERVELQRLRLAELEQCLTRAGHLARAR